MPIVSAVGIGFSAGMSPEMLAPLEAACVEAVKQCQERGITDTDVIRQAVLDARDRVLDSRAE